MAHQFAAVAFTSEIKQVQRELGSRDGYASLDQGDEYNSLLSEQEAGFIRARDSFYIASVSETDWPYVQHRGGPKGFLKVLNEKTIGFADFSGNRQYISTGNFRKNDRVALILMDYPNRTRLKILGRVRTVTDDLELLASLENPGYRARVERAFVIDVHAFDWNCPQHITPRHTNRDIEKLLAPLEAEKEALKKQNANNLAAYPNVLGEGELELEITGIRQLTSRIRAYELRDGQGGALPVVSGGSHLQIPIQLESGEQVLRHYSICSNPLRRDIYEIAVLHKDSGKASPAIHRYFQLGQKINCSVPANYFSVHLDERPAMLIAGGIGITPIKALAQQMSSRKLEFTLHYAGRQLQEMAFQGRLQREFGERVHIYTTATRRMNVATLLNQAPKNSQIYACGPQSLLDELLQQGKQLKIDPDRLHFERFGVDTTADNEAFSVQLARSGRQINVSANETMLDALLNADIAVPYSCTTGECKTCAMSLLEGEVIHRDNCLTTHEKDRGLFCPCVSRAKNDSITMDI